MVIKTAGLIFGITSKRAKTDTIVLHHAAATRCSVEDVHRWHKDNGWSGIGYHFFVRKDGTVWRGRAEDRIGAHTTCNNATSIGICFEGHFERETMPKEQLNAGLELIAHLKDKYNIKRVVGHKELRNTLCPGKNFPLERLKGAQSETARVLSFQSSAIEDGFKLPKFGADGVWGDETESVAKKAIVKKRLFYKHKSLTRLVQQAVGVTVDGLCGKKTVSAIKKWQASNDLEIDGEWGVNCWNKWRSLPK